MVLIDCDVHGHVSLQTDKLPEDMAEQALQSSPNESFAKDMQRQGSRMETIWKRTMNQHYQVSDRYNSVAALIVRWDDELDKDLNCKHEVKELNTLFNDDFNFKSTILRLDTITKPQQQLNYAIADLVFRYDGPCRTHLLIVYYSGHGIGRGEGDLELAGTPKDGFPLLEGGGRYEPKLRWLLAERDLDHAEADVLIVLDCCCAANIMKKELSDDAKAHEVLAASGRWQVAEQPGPRSFTRHFIDALKEELSKNDRQPFTTYDLNEVITRKRMHITKIESKIFNRHANARNKRHIGLAPLDHLRDSTSEEQGFKRRRGREAAYLDLRVAFNNRTRLEDDEVTHLATKMFEAAKSTDLSISCIDWMGFKPRKEAVILKQSLQTVFRAVYYAKRWKRLIRRSNKRKASTLLDEDYMRPAKRPAASSQLSEQVPNWTSGPLSPTPSNPSSFDSPRPSTNHAGPEG